MVIIKGSMLDVMTQTKCIGINRIRRLPFIALELVLNAG
jgi:hypothetical protein